MANQGGKPLTALYQDKLRLFKSLEMLSRQCAAVTIDYRKLPDTGITRLQALLDERAKLIAEIDALDVEIAAREEGGRDSTAAAVRAEIAGVAERIRQMDAGLEKALERETGMLKEAVHQEQRGQRSARAYRHKPEAGEGFFVDKIT